MYEASGGGYTHDGLSLAGDPVDADAIVVQFTTQTLKVYVHLERDQVYGYTGSSLDGDDRIGGVVDIQVRHRDANGRPRLFTTAQWDSEDNTTIYTSGSRRGTYTYTNLPADANVFVTADAADDYMLLDPRSLAAYGDEDGLMGGAFGDDGGWGHTVSLCPLMAVDPTGQDHGECGSFAVVNTYGVTANVSKRRVRTSGVGFRSSDTPNGSVTHQSGLTVELTPVEGKNLGGNARSRTTASSNDQTRPGDERRALDFGTMAAGTYALGLPEGWRATDQDGGRGQNAFAPLDGAVTLTVEPSTATLYGFVRNARQEGLEGVTVHVNGTETVTDEWGRYIASGIPAVPGHSGEWDQFFVHTSRPGFPDSRPDSTDNPKGVVGDDDYDPNYDDVPGFGANTVQRHDFNLSGANNTFTVTGTVREVNTGAPISGARILAGGRDPLNGRTSGRGDWLGQVRTGSDGTYTAIVAATGVGTFVNMTASASGYTFLPDEGIPVHAQAGTSHSVDFTGHSRGKVVGRVVAPGGGNASGIKVTVYEGTSIVTNADGDTINTLDDMTTTSTGTFSLDVGAYGSFFIEAVVDCVVGPVTEAENDLCRQKEFSWFDYPSGQVGTVISAGQPVQLDIQMRSVQPRFVSATRGRVEQYAVAAGTPGGHTFPGDYTNALELTWEYDNRDRPTDGFYAPGTVTVVEADDDLTTDGSADVSGLTIGTTTYVTKGTTTAFDATVNPAGDGNTVTVTATTAITIDAANYNEIKGMIELAVTGLTFDHTFYSGDQSPRSAEFTVPAVDTKPSDVQPSRSGDDLTATWRATGSPAIAHQVALLVPVSGGAQWLFVPDALDDVARVVAAEGRGRWTWTLDKTAVVSPNADWASVDGSGSHPVTAADLGMPLMIRIYSRHGTGAQVMSEANFP